MCSTANANCFNGEKKESKKGENNIEKFPLLIATDGMRRTMSWAGEGKGGLSLRRFIAGEAYGSLLCFSQKNSQKWQKQYFLKRIALVAEEVFG